MNHRPSRRRSRLAVAVVLACAAAAEAQVLNPPPAQTRGDARHAFDLPAGDLALTLSAIAQITGRRVKQGAVAQGAAQAPAVKGQLTLDEALALVSAQPGGRLVLLAPDGEITLAEPMRVTVQGSRMAHLAKANRTGTRVDVDPMALPQSVISVDKGLLEQQQVRDVRDALSNVAGIGTATADSPTSAPTITLRGFTATIMRNGNVVPQGSPFNPPAIAIERVEVAKGPEAIVAGTTSYGGVVNVITKAPVEGTVRELLVSVGERARRELGVDLAQPLSEDGSWTSRLILSSAAAGRTAVGYLGARRDYAAPSLHWSGRDTGTDLSATFEWQRSRAAPVSEYLFDPERPFDTSGGLHRTGPADTHIVTLQSTSDLTLNQRLGAGWTAGLKIGRSSSRDGGDAVPTFVAPDLGFPYPKALSIVDRIHDRISTDTVKLELGGGFDTAGIEHELMLAYDRLKSRSTGSSRRERLFSTDLRTGEQTDITGSSTAADLGMPDTEDFLFRSTALETGLMALDHMSWGPWNAVLGLRRITYRSEDLEAGDVAQQSKLLGSLGLVYRWSPDLSGFGSVAQGFVPNLGLITFDRKPLPPNHSTQAEIGAKALLLDRRLAVTGSLYRIREVNLAVEDPLHPPDPLIYSVTIPGASVKGLDLDVSGDLGPTVSVRANYGYIDKRATSAESIGLPFARHTVNLWSTLRLTGDAASGWWVGGGANWQSRVVGARADAVAPGSQYRLDLSAGYEQAQWSFVVGVKNLTDRVLYSLNSDGKTYGSVLQPRSISASARYTF